MIDQTDLQEMFTELREQLQQLTHRSEILGNLRATLIVNFGPEGKAGKKAGVTIENHEGMKDLELLVAVLKGLTDQIDNLQEQLSEATNP